jgi:hypothetical protein
VLASRRTIQRLLPAYVMPVVDKGVWKKGERYVLLRGGLYAGVKESPM